MNTIILHTVLSHTATVWIVIISYCPPQAENFENWLDFKNEICIFDAIMPRSNRNLNQNIRDFTISATL